MKKLKLFLIVSLFFLPFMVKAEVCNDDKVSVSSITMEQKSENVIEVNNASVNGKRIQLDLNVFEVGDNIQYKMELKNDSDEDYEFHEDAFQSDSDYMEYTLTTEDNSNIVKAHSTKTVYLKVEYKNEVSESFYENGKYNDNQSLVLNLSNKDSMINPETGRNLFILLIMILFIAGITFYFLSTKKNKQLMIFIVGMLVLIPICVQAICRYDISLTANIQIDQKKTCVYDGELVPGAEYVNGQYTYHYKQQYIGNGNWQDMESDGWGMTLTDEESTDPVTTKMCTRISSKPITSLWGCFYKANASLIDISSFDTSNVTTMRAMFIYSTTPVVVGLDKLDTSQVTSMTNMFRKTAFTELDLSNFNTSNVINFGSMFHSSIIEHLDINHFNTSNATNMEFMFYGSKITELDLSNWDLSNITNVKSMFRVSDVKKVYVKDQIAYDKLNSSSFKPTDLVIEIKN